MTSETALTDSISAYGWSLVSVAADRGRVEEDDLAELVLGVPGDPERGGVAVDPRPVVLGVVLQVVRVAGRPRPQFSLLYSGFSRTSAVRALPRTSISISVPGCARSAGRYAMPIA